MEPVPGNSALPTTPGLLKSSLIIFMFAILALSSNSIPQTSLIVENRFSKFTLSELEKASVVFRPSETV